jgi:hypothetical protein
MKKGDDNGQKDNRQLPKQLRVSHGDSEGCQEQQLMLSTPDGISRLMVRLR